MKISQGVQILRNLIREHISVIEEGGHGGRIDYINVPKLFQVLENYSLSGPPNQKNIISFVDSLEKICDSTQTLTAYSGRGEIGSPKAPITKAYSVIARAYNPESIMQYGSPNPKLIERQVMDALGASFYNEDKSSGFISIFGATLGWAMYPDPKTPGAMALSKSVDSQLKNDKKISKISY